MPVFIRIRRYAFIQAKNCARNWPIVSCSAIHWGSSFDVYHTAERAWSSYCYVKDRHSMYNLPASTVVNVIGIGIPGQQDSRTANVTQWDRIHQWYASAVVCCTHVSSEFDESLDARLVSSSGSHMKGCNTHMQIHSTEYSWLWAARTPYAFRK